MASEAVAAKRFSRNENNILLTNDELTTFVAADNNGESSRPRSKKLSFDAEMAAGRRSSVLGSDKFGGMSTGRLERERKIGHWRVNEDGEVTYKKKPMSELMSAIQLGIGQSVGGLTPKPMRDVLYEDFHVVETVFFPREGSNLTPAHRYSDFRFRTFAPVAFRYFRELFSIRPEDFLLSLCVEPLQELSNPGASGSIFYISDDDEFIIKTVQHKEAEFLQKLLPGYYMNLNQNPCTLLPKFYGLYCYQCGGKNIRFVVMNNLLPSYIRLDEKYDLKGSTYKRKASRHEKSKRTPTLKDLDFLELNSEGIFLDADMHAALIRTIDRDCRVLQSFKIMDYSLLLGVHNLDVIKTVDIGNGLRRESVEDNSFGRARGRSIRPRVAQYSTAMAAIQQVQTDTNLDGGGIPATNSRGERLLLYVGIIDVLQSYRFAKKLEHTFKSLIHDGDTISVHQPGFYAQRFQSFCSEQAFRIRPPGTKRKSIVPGRRKSTALPPDGDTRLLDSYSSESRRGDEVQEVPDKDGRGRRPDILPRSTPPRGQLATSTRSLHENISTVGLTTEDNYVTHQLIKNNVDHHRSVDYTGHHLSVVSLAVSSTLSHDDVQTGATTSMTSSSPSRHSQLSSNLLPEDQSERSMVPFNDSVLSSVTTVEVINSRSNMIGQPITANHIDHCNDIGGPMSSNPCNDSQMINHDSNHVGDNYRRIDDNDCDPPVAFSSSVVATDNEDTRL